MKTGDLIEFPMGYSEIYALALIVKVWEFKEYCDMHDELELEYDVDDAWDHWQIAGPLLDVIHPSAGNIVKIWGRET